MRPVLLFSQLTRLGRGSRTLYSRLYRLVVGISYCLLVVYGTILREVCTKFALMFVRFVATMPRIFVPLFSSDIATKFSLRSMASHALMYLYRIVRERVLYKCIYATGYHGARRSASSFLK